MDGVVYCELRTTPKVRAHRTSACRGTAAAIFSRTLPAHCRLPFIAEQPRCRDDQEVLPGISAERCVDSLAAANTSVGMPRWGSGELCRFDRRRRRELRAGWRRWSGPHHCEASPLDRSPRECAAASPLPFLRKALGHFGLPVMSRAGARSHTPQPRRLRSKLSRWRRSTGRKGSWGSTCPGTRPGAPSRRGCPPCRGRGTAAWPSRSTAPRWRTPRRSARCSPSGRSGWCARSHLLWQSAARFAREGSHSGSDTPPVFLPQGHAVTAAMNDELRRELLESRIPVELCLTSNVLSQSTPSYGRATSTDRTKLTILPCFPCIVAGLSASNLWLFPEPLSDNMTRQGAPFRRPGGSGPSRVFVYRRLGRVRDDAFA